jgi:serine/threonine protein kinase
MKSYERSGLPLWSRSNISPSHKRQTTQKTDASAMRRKLVIKKPVQRKIGTGRFANVFLCQTGRDFHISKKPKGSDQARQFIDREIAVLRYIQEQSSDEGSSVNSPIIRMTGAIAGAYIRFAYEGITPRSIQDRSITKDLCAYLQPTSPDLSDNFKFQVMLQLASALTYLYDLRIAHRDIKPENILIIQTRRQSLMNVKVKLCDFGCAHHWKGEDARFFGMQLGTRAYQSYEQVMYGNAGRKSDVWTLGAVFYSLLTQTMLIDPEDVRLYPGYSCPLKLYSATRQYLLLQYYDKVLYAKNDNACHMNMLLQYEGVSVFSKLLRGMLKKNSDDRLSPKEVHAELLRIRRDGASPT